MNVITIIGLLAAILTTIAQLPQLMRTFKTKSTEDISLLTYISLNIGGVLWLIYGLLIKDLPLIIANIITLSFVLGVLILKIKYYDQ